MTRNRSIWILVTTLSLGGLTAPASAQQPSEARIQELIRVAAERVASGQGAAPGQAPAQTTPPAPDTRPVVRLSLDDAVKLALDRNLDIAVQRLNPQINDIAIASLRSIYHPTLTSTISQVSTTQASTNDHRRQQRRGHSRSTTISSPTTAASRRVCPRAAARFRPRSTTSGRRATATTSLFNPVYNTNWSGTYTQPLMRGFKTDSTRQQIQVTKINRDISDVQLKASITNTLSNVRNAYWDFVFATQAVEVARQSLDLADQARAGQPDARAGRHDGADRRRAGAVGAGDAQPGARHRGIHEADDRARAQALDRQRHRRSELGRRAGAHRSAGLPARRDRSRRRRPPRAQRAHRTWTSRRRTSQANDVTLRYLNDQTLPQVDLLR